MSHVKSPYNFVPAPIEDQVFTPEWASCVSHDIPFEDGESGEITLEITAETPIFSGTDKRNFPKKTVRSLPNFPTFWSMAKSSILFPPPR